MSSTETHTLVIEREMAHPQDKIWRALTDGSLISQWLMANDFQPVVGHKFTFRMPPQPEWNGIIEAEVLTVEPTTKLSYTWNSMGLESIVRWTLSSTASGTRVRMEQSGFKSDQDYAYKGANYGWQNFLAKLEEVVGA